MKLYHGTSERDGLLIAARGFSLASVGSRQRGLRGGADAPEVRGVYLARERARARWYAGPPGSRPGLGQGGAVVEVEVSGRLMEERAWWRLLHAVKEQIGATGLYDPRAQEAIDEAVKRARAGGFVGLWENDEEAIVFDPRRVKVLGVEHADTGEPMDESYRPSIRHSGQSFVPFHTPGTMWTGDQVSYYVAGRAGPKRIEVLVYDRKGSGPIKKRREVLSHDEAARLFQSGWGSAASEQEADLKVRTLLRRPVESYRPSHTSRDRPQRSSPRVPPHSGREPGGSLRQLSRYAVNRTDLLEAAVEARPTRVAPTDTMGFTKTPARFAAAWFEVVEGDRVLGYVQRLRGQKYGGLDPNEPVTSEWYAFPWYEDEGRVGRRQGPMTSKGRAVAALTKGPLARWIEKHRRRPNESYRPIGEAVLRDEPAVTRGAVEFHYWDGQDASKVPPESMGGPAGMVEPLVDLWARASKLVRRLPGGAALMSKRRRVVMVRRLKHILRGGHGGYVWPDMGGAKMPPGTTRPGDVLTGYVLKPAEDLRTLLHEIGHAYWYEVVSKARALTFIDAHYAVDRSSGNFDPKAFVSPYAWTNPEEDFAESFVAYLTGEKWEKKPAAMKRFMAAIGRPVGESLDEGDTASEKLGKVGPFDVYLTLTTNRYTPSEWATRRRGPPGGAKAPPFERERVRELLGAVKEAWRFLKLAGISAKAVAGPIKFIEKRALGGHRFASFGGWYNTGADLVVIVGTHKPDKYVVQSLLHEIAHRMWFKHLGNVGRRAWTAFIARIGKPMPDKSIRRIFTRAAQECMARGLSGTVAEVGDEYMEMVKRVNAAVSVKLLKPDGSYVIDWQPPLMSHQAVADQFEHHYFDEVREKGTIEACEKYLLGLVKSLMVWREAEELPSDYARVNPEEGWAEAIADLTWKRGLDARSKEIVKREVHRALGLFKESVMNDRARAVIRTVLSERMAPHREFKRHPIDYFFPYLANSREEAIGRVREYVESFGYKILKYDVQGTTVRVRFADPTTKRAGRSFIAEFGVAQHAGGGQPGWAVLGPYSMSDFDQRVRKIR